VHPVGSYRKDKLNQYGLWGPSNTKLRISNIH